MRVNIYAEEMTERVEIISKEIDGQTFTGLRFYLELPTSLPPGVVAMCPSQGANQPAIRAFNAEAGSQENPDRVAVQGPFIHRPGDDDSSAVTFWGKRDLRKLLEVAKQKLDKHYSNTEEQP